MGMLSGLNAREWGLMYVGARDCGRMRFFWWGVDVALM
ncbi:hypothetical protein ABIE58_002119 [Roseovarius sp. MBR-78]|jgi:hypothetical protein